MQVGVVFPQTEIGADPGAVREFAQAAEGLGYKHILAFDHVLGADASARQEWNKPYSSDDMFHELFVLFGYLAGCTEAIEMVSGILILPQRQTALVAKQAAAVDVLTQAGYTPVAALFPVELTFLKPTLSIPYESVIKYE